EEVNARLAQRLAHRLGLAALVIVVAEHGDDRDAQATQLIGEGFRLLALAEVGQVAGKGEDVGALADLGGEVAVFRPRIAGDVEVADRRDPETTPLSHFPTALPRRSPSPGRWSSRRARRVDRGRRVSADGAAPTAPRGAASARRGASAG